MGQDLRSFLDMLGEEHPEEVLGIERRVSPAFELTAVVRSFEAR